MVQTISLNSVRNSNLIRLIKNNILKPGEGQIAIHNGKPIVGVTHITKNAVRASLEHTDKFSTQAKANFLNSIPDDYNIIIKYNYCNKGKLITSEHEVLENSTRLRKYRMETPNGFIEQRYMPDGSISGTIWGPPNEAIIWDYNGNITSPYPTCITEPNSKNSKSLDAFRAAVDYIKGKGSLEAYRKEMAK